MSRLMYDSVTAADIPTMAAIVGGYVDGPFAWSAADWARFPNALKNRTAISPLTDDGNELDVETGDATPQQAPAWVQMRRRAGVTPTVYMNASTWGAVVSAFQAAGVPQPLYRVAQYDGVATIPAGAVGKQYRCGDIGCAAYSGGHYDLSVVADHWPGVDSEMLDPNDPIVQEIRSRLGGIANAVEPAGGVAAPGEDVLRIRNVETLVIAMQNSVTKIQATLAQGAGTSGLTQDQQNQLNDIQTKLTAVEAALKTA